MDVMDKTPAQQGSRLSTAACYAIALMLVAIALGTRELIGPAYLGLRFATFLPAVVLAAVLCGFWPAMLVTVLSSVLATFFYMPPYAALPLDFHAQTVTWNLAFLVDALIMCAAIQGMHYHYRRFRAAKRHLAVNHRLLSAIVEGTTDAVFVKDATGRYLLSNGAHANALGMNASEICGKRDSDLYTAEQARALAAADGGVVASGDVATYEEVLRFPDGEERAYLTTKGPTFDESGKINGIFGISRDISTRRDEAEQFKLMIRTSLDGFWDSDDEGRIHEANDAECELEGYSREELLGMRISDLAVDETPQEIALHLQQLMATGGARFDRRHRAKDGRVVDLEVAANHTPKYGGRFYCFLRDVTERKRAEQALRQSTELLQAHIENSPMALIAWDQDYRVTQWAGESERMFGWRAAETVGTLLMDLHMVYPEDVPLVQETMAKLSDGKSRHVVSANRNLTKDGRVIDCVWYNTVLGDSTGKMASIMSQVLDVTEQKRAEQAIVESEIRFHGLFEGLGEGVQLCELLVDEAGEAVDFVVLDVNPAYEKHTGLKRDAVVGRRMTEVLPNIEAAWLARFAAVVKTGAPIRFEKYNASLGRWFEVHASPLGGLRFATVFSDISERRKYERKLKAAKAEAERANNAKSRFLAAASHDLRQPMSALKLYVGVLKGKLPEDDQELLLNMQECVSGLSDLLSNLLDLSKLEAGVVTPQLSDFDLDHAFSKLLAAHAPQADAKALSLRCGLYRVTARTDPVLFQRIVGNLLANALRYTERGGVLIAVRRRLGKMWVEVWDTGVGIPPDKITEVFEEFKQLGDPARTRGSGLGLTIVAKTAELLGLQIRVRSRPGRGSMFAIELPLGRGVGERSAKYPQLPSPLGGVRIAVVDDNPIVLNALVCAMENAGHEVIAAASGESLLARLEARPPQIMVCDYRLAGGETGYDVITAARKVFGSELPAIIITGDTDPALLRSMAEKRIVIQHKPVEFETLQRRIEEAIRQPAHALQ